MNRNFSRHIFVAAFRVCWIFSAVVFCGPLSHAFVTKLLVSPVEQNLPAYESKSKDIPLQAWFDATTVGINLTDRADVDLMTFYGKNPSAVARVPRYMMVRDWIRLRYDSKLGYSLRVTGRAKIDLPVEVFQIQDIQSVQLANHKLVYKGISLNVRTNPAASRGEKLFLQNCLSCHATPRTQTIEPLSLITKLTADHLSKHTAIHSTALKTGLTPKDIRGLEAYRDALVAQKSVIK
jgi:hypothetical protein